MQQMDNEAWSDTASERPERGTPTNKVQLRAIVPNGVSITGWAYLYA